MPGLPRPPVGFPLLMVPDDQGRLHWPDLETSVVERIKVILQTRPGEQLMRPRFGAGLQRFIGASDAVGTRRRIKESVEAALARHEPRIRVDAVQVLDGTAPGHLRIEIHYRLRWSGASRRLGLTLALQQG